VSPPHSPILLSFALTAIIPKPNLQLATQPPPLIICSTPPPLQRLAPPGINVKANQVFSFFVVKPLVLLVTIVVLYTTVYNSSLICPLPY